MNPGRERRHKRALKINHLVQELRSLGCAVMWFDENELNGNDCVDVEDAMQEAGWKVVVPDNGMGDPE